MAALPIMFSERKLPAVSLCWQHCVC